MSITEVQEETAKSPVALPDELVAKVLGYLPLQDRFRLETVCRQWQRCMYVEVEWLYLKFRHKAAQKYTLRINYLGKFTGPWTQELPAVLHKLRISKVGRLRCDIEDEICDKELLVLLADIASRATEVVVGYDIRYRPASFFTFCDIIGPRVTIFQLGLHPMYEESGYYREFMSTLATLIGKRLKNFDIKWLDVIRDRPHYASDYYV